MIKLQAGKLYSDEYGADERIQFTTVLCNFDYSSPGGSTIIRTSICFTIGISINLICSMFRTCHVREIEYTPYNQSFGLNTAKHVRIISKMISYPHIYTLQLFSNGIAHNKHIIG